MAKILIGPAGSGGSKDEGFILVKNSGLDALEIEFTYSIWMTKEDAMSICNLNKKLNLQLSIHAPYYINLNSADKKKIEASKKRILKCCELGELLGAKSVVFHPGYYGKDSHEKAYKNIKTEMIEMMNALKGKKIVLCPETMGKQSQFGDLDELIRLKKETGCGICIDFAHLRARHKGKLTFEEIARKIKEEKLGHIHAHFSGIEWSEKGERRHLLTPMSEIKALLKALKKYKIDCTIINESPDPLGDAIKMKKILKKL